MAGKDTAWMLGAGPPTSFSISTAGVGHRGGCQGVWQVLELLVRGPSGLGSLGQARQWDLKLYQAIWGKRISLASLSPALAMCQHVCLETFAKSPACWMGSTTHSLQLFSGQSKCRSGMGLVWQDMAGGSSRDSSMLQLLQAQNNQFNPRVDVEYEWWLGQDDMYESDEDLDEKVRNLHGPETLEDLSLCMPPQALLPPHWSRRSCTG